jgi:signal peptidase I
MELVSQSLSKWFYLGVLAAVVGVMLIYKARGDQQSKLMENGYFILILGLVGVISEWVDFSTVLFIFVLITGFILLLDKLVLAKRRTLKHVTLIATANKLSLEPQSELQPNVLQPKPHYVHYAREFFPIVLAVWVLRAFLFEAYQIPTSSMRPDLTVGDFILVNKFSYGIREPFTNKVIIPVGSPKRGDVMVIKDQNTKNRDLIKRVVGIGGDKIEYYNKRLTINGVPLEYVEAGTYDYSDTYPQVGEVNYHNEQYIENLSGVKHHVITWDQAPTITTSSVRNFPKRENCIYANNDGFTCVVPQGEYFMMGDNRDNSDDGRYWGFVPDDSVLGRAMYVWLNFHDLKRIGTKI